MVSLSDTFDQDDTTCKRDIDKLLTLSSLFTDKWIYLPAKGSREHRKLRSCGAFECMEGVYFAGDCTHLSLKEPKEWQLFYFNVKYGCHCYLYYTLVDGYGVTRLLRGPFFGGEADSTIVGDGDLVRELDEKYLNPHELIIYDSALGKGVKFGHYICPTGGFVRKADTIVGRCFDRSIRLARYIVEHSYSRVKCKFPIIGGKNVISGSLDATFKLCVALTNMFSMLVSPMRDTCCGNRKCNYCRLSDLLDTEAA